MQAAKAQVNLIYTIINTDARQKRASEITNGVPISNIYSETSGPHQWSKFKKNADPYSYSNSSSKSAFLAHSLRQRSFFALFSFVCWFVFFFHMWCDLRNHRINRWAKFSGTSKNRKKMKNSRKNVYWNFQWISTYTFTYTRKFHRKVSFCAFLALPREIKSIFGNHSISRYSINHI